MVEIGGSGGIAHYTFNLLKYYPDPSQIVLYTGTPYEFEHEELISSTKLTFNRLKTNPIKILHFFYDIIKYKPLLVHFQLSQYPSFILCLLFIVKLLGTKVILTAHNVVSHESGLLDKYIFRMLYKNSDKIIVHSNFSKKKLMSKFNIHEDRVVKIDHGNYGFFDDLNNNTKEFTSDTFRILFFGYIRKYKGLDVLLKAISLPKLREKEFKLMIAGKPVESFDRYNDLIVKYNIEEKIVTQLGYIPLREVNTYFHDASVVVLPYHHIDQSGVLHLAYAFSKPVIASAVGGFPEVIEDGYSGYLVPPGDAEALSDALYKMIDNNNHVKELGKRAGELSKTRFSWKKIAIETEKLYSSIM